MTANEVRIGNLVQYGTVCEVVTIHAGGVIKVRPPKHSGPAYETGISKVYAIPLTEEWLLRMGFTKYLEPHNMIVWSDELFWIWQLRNGEEVFDDFMYAENHNWNSVPTDNIDIDYLHTLQNLYFALTGEELTIKEQ